MAQLRHWYDSNIHQRAGKSVLHNPSAIMNEYKMAIQISKEYFLWK